MKKNSARRVTGSSVAQAPLLFCVISLPLNIFSAHAEELQTLQTTVISGDNSTERMNTGADGRYQLNQQDLQRYGSVNGDMTEALKTLPNVQFSDDAGSYEALTDLRPQSLSISGGRYYNNHFSINGLSNNSLLDPAGRNTDSRSIDDVPGHEQAIFMDPDQLGSIQVYDSNVPAEYGRFTGGVIDARIRDATHEPVSRASYYTTGSQWTKYRVIVHEENISNTSDYRDPSQESFYRKRLTLSHERGISDNQAIRFSLSGSQSGTPMQSLNKSEEIREQAISASLTHSWAAAGNKITSFFSYSPYEKDTVIGDVKDSRYQISAGGLLLTSNAEWLLHGQTHWFTLAASQSHNNRRAPVDHFHWLNTASVHWGADAGESSSRQGGYGDLNKDQSSLSFSWKTATPISGLFSKVTYGAAVSESIAGFERPQQTMIYDHVTGADNNPIGLNTAVQCRYNNYDCIDGEQYFSQRKIYPQDKVHVSLAEAALFSELSYQGERSDTTLGLRADYDDFLQNLNLAWRSRISYDLFADQSWYLIAGANRYYGASLITYKLREAAAPYYTQYRSTTSNVVNDWEEDSGQPSFLYRFRDTETPYSDELTLALKARLFGGQGELKLLERNTEKEFSQTETEVGADGFYYKETGNDGDTLYHSISLAWDRSSGRTNVGFNATWSDTETSNISYDDEIDAEKNSQPVWYRGEIQTLGSINQMRTNYANPLVLNVYAAAQLSDSIHASIKARYLHRYRTVVKANASGSSNDDLTNPDDLTNIGTLDWYKDSYRPASLLFDTSIRWQPLANDSLSFVAEIKNLLNSRTYTIEETDEAGIEIGRTVWLGIEAVF